MYTRYDAIMNGVKSLHSIEQLFSGSEVRWEYFPKEQHMTENLAPKIPVAVSSQSQKRPRHDLARSDLGRGG